LQDLVHVDFNQMHLIQLISSLVETAESDKRLSEKRKKMCSIEGIPELWLGIA